MEGERLRDVPLLVMLPPKLIATATANALKVPPLFTVTSPVKVFVPVALFIVKVPVTEVAPLTEKAVVNDPIFTVPLVIVK